MSLEKSTLEKEKNKVQEKLELIKVEKVKWDE